jgi:hypothetical protein
MGGSAKDGAQWFLNALPLWESKMFKALVEKANKHQIKPLGYHCKGLEV